jgi:CSLREA domain-containing protein
VFGLKHAWHSRSRQVSRPVRRAARLSVESLEGRCLPAMFVVTTTEDIVDPDDGVLSLREAVLEANARPGADEIRLPAFSGSDPLGGTGALVYRLSIPNEVFIGDDENAGATGDLDITDDVRIIGAGPTLTTIDAAGIDRVFDVRSGNVVMRGLTITGGVVPFRNSQGGGIRNQDTLTLENCAVRHNNDLMARGGGVANLGSLVVRDTVIAENWAWNGGGIWSGGDVEVVRGTIMRNRGGGISNGGIAVVTGALIARNRGGVSNGVDGVITLTDCVISDNGADSGAGISNSGALVIAGGSIRDNDAGIEGGGGIRNYPTGRFTISDATISGNYGGFGGAGGIFNEGSGDIVRSTISGNDAEWGGGIFNAPQGDLRLVQSTVSGNLAYFGPGGGALNRGALTVINATFSGNEAEYGAGIYNDGGLSLTNATLARNAAGESVRGSGGAVFNAGALRLLNTLIADNAAGAAADLDNRGTIARARNNLIGSPEGHDLRWGDDGNIVGVAPVLSPLQDFGGPTLVHAPLPGSPAIDAGTSLAAPLTDQRGIARPLDGDGDGVPIFDIGAVEILNPHHLVTLVFPSQLGLRLDGIALELVDLPTQRIILKEPFNAAGSMHILVSFDGGGGNGGGGDDDVEMAVALAGAQELFLLLDGGPGFDVGRATANVLVKNIEQFTPLRK